MEKILPNIIKCKRIFKLDDQLVSCKELKHRTAECCDKCLARVRATPMEQGLAQKNGYNIKCQYCPNIVIRDTNTKKVTCPRCKQQMRLIALDKRKKKVV